MHRTPLLAVQLASFMHAAALRPALVLCALDLALVELVLGTACALNTCL
jgi:hypothetical protein